MQPVGDRRAQALERLVGALLRDEGDLLADLAVVDRVLDAVGDRRVAARRRRSVMSNTSRWPTSRSRLADAVVRVEREPADLDRDRRLRGRSLVVVVVVSSSSSYSSSVALVHPARDRSSGHRERIGDRRTSWTRNTLRAALEREHVGGDRRRHALGRPSRPVSLPRKLLREVPITSGRPSATSSSRRRSSSRLCSTRLAEADPGVEPDPLLAAPPRATANASRSSRKALTSATTSS